MNNTNTIHSQNSKFYVRCTVASVAVISACTTLAALFFLNIIPLNSPIASLASGCACISLNIFPIIIISCSIYHFTKISSKASDHSASSHEVSAASSSTSNSTPQTNNTAPTSDAQLQDQLRSAVQNGSTATVQQILGSVTTKDMLAALLVPPNAYPLLTRASQKGHLEIVQLILNKAAHFGLLADMFFFGEEDRKYCTVAYSLGRPEIATYVLKFLESHPDLLKEVLQWKAPHSGRSLFQLAVEEDSQEGRATVTAAVLHAAETLDMCMSIVTYTDYHKKSCFDSKIDASPLLIQCIMNAVKTPENQLQVVNLAKDEDGAGAMKFVNNESVLEIVKYELFCSIKMHSEIGIIEHILTYWGEECAKNGVLTEALQIANEYQYPEAATALSNLSYLLI